MGMNRVIVDPTRTGSSPASEAASRLVNIINPLNPAWLVVTASLGLSLLGMYGIDVAERLHPGAPESAEAAKAAGLLFKQGLFLCIGVLAAIGVAFPHYKWYGYFSNVLLVGMLGVLAFLLVPFVPESIVHARKGQRSWINMGFTDWQPSEMAKIVYVLMVSQLLRNTKSHREFWGLVPIGLTSMIPVALIMLQPDLGQSLLFLPTLFAMLVAAGAKLRHLTLIVLIAMTAAPLSYPILKQHQKDRIVGLIKQFKGDRSSDRDINFQGETAQMLVGAGGVTGVDNEKSRALVRFSALPERHNDMVFSVIANRLGFKGVVAVLVLYFLWTVGAFLVAAGTPDPFGRLVCVGLTTFIVTQAFVNIAMNVGLMPIIGITLPFVSYGGSSLVTVWMMTGLVFNVSIREKGYRLTEAFEFTPGNPRRVT